MLQTLKDHLYQCPSKLSEEMVRCMAVVYCWLCGAASTNPGKHRSPLLSRSSTNVLLPRHVSGEESDWSCKSTVEITWISTDKSQFSRASYAINNYRFVLLTYIIKDDNLSFIGNFPLTFGGPLLHNLNEI